MRLVVNLSYESAIFLYGRSQYRHLYPAPQQVVAGGSRLRNGGKIPPKEASIESWSRSEWSTTSKAYHLTLGLDDKPLK